MFESSHDCFKTKCLEIPSERCASLKPPLIPQACRHFNDSGLCKDTCPPANIYEPSIFLLKPNKDKKFSFGAACVKECPRTFGRALLLSPSPISDFIHLSIPCSKCLSSTSSGEFGAQGSKAPRLGYQSTAGHIIKHNQALWFLQNLLTTPQSQLWSLHTWLVSQPG